MRKYLMRSSMLIISTISSAEQTAPGSFLHDRTASSHESRPVSSACSISLAQFAHPVADANGVTSLLIFYGSVCGADITALDDVFDSEDRDPEWAEKIEGNIREVIAPFQGSKIAGECRSSLCRLRLRMGGSDPKETEFKFRSTIAMSLRDSRYAVGYLAIPDHRNLLYLYSLQFPPAFLEPFLQHMQK